MTQTEIRRITPADWAGFREIRLEMLQIEPPVFGTPAPDWAKRTPSQVQAWLRDLRAFGAFEGPRILGTAVYFREKGARVAHRANVVAVYVRPEARGRGLLGAMLTVLEADARAEGVEQLELQVVSGNTRAIAAYTRVGFRRIGTLPRALRSAAGDQDEEIMVKPLV